MSTTIGRRGSVTLHAKTEHAFTLRARDLPKSCFTIRFDGHKIANNRDSFELMKMAPEVYRWAEAILQSRLTAKGRHDQSPS